MSENHLDSALNEYFAECDELIQRVSESLQLIEKSVHNAETLDSVYRDIHTLKGSSQLFGYKQIGEVAHAMESSLDPIRKKKRKPDPALVEAIFKCLDVIEQMIAAVKANEEKDFSEVIGLVIPRLVDASLEAIGDVLRPPNDDFLPPGVFDVPPVDALGLADLLDSRVPKKAELTNREAVKEVVRNESVQEVKLPEAPSQTGKNPPESIESSSSIRVPVALLDNLMTLMGEMVLVRNQVLQYANSSDDLEFLNLSQRLDVVTSEIQGEVMKTRMQPIGNILSKFQRVVRDLAKELGKKIELSLSGIETELDKTLIEAVKDPLMHIVRNACDHGIETPEVRKAAGKSDLGHVSIRSFHEGGQVIVEISDNGRGLDRVKLTQKAVEKGILTLEKAATLSERDAFALIFAPGFSTAAHVTNVSGRGVGMDVVKSNIERIGGIVELHSQTGKGTSIRLKIPLTLAIVPAMIIRCGSSRYAIPQVKLVELVRVEKNSGTQQIEYLQGKPVYRLRGSLLSIVSLSEVLGCQTNPETKVNDFGDIANIVVVAAERQLFGIIVDEVQDTADIVVKPLSSFLKSVSIYSGATVLGDGSVALILDVVGMAQHQSLVKDGSSKVRDEAMEGKSGKLDDAQAISNEMQEFLLFTLGTPTKHAMPLGLVHRLEEFPRSAVEYSGKQRIVRYRNSVLPLISLSELLGTHTEVSNSNSSDSIPVIVSQRSGKLYGLEVNEILDVFATLESMDDSVSDHPGIMGNVLAADQVLVVLDILKILEDFSTKIQGRNLDCTGVLTSSSKHGHFLGRNQKRVGGKILLVEDTAFFRKHVASVLERAGFEVTLTVNGAEALALLEKSKRDRFDLVLADIEMPQMNGLQLATAIRKDANWMTVPLIALTTRCEPHHVEEGRKAGFDQYLEKLNPEVLLREMTALLLNTQKVNTERKNTA